MCDCVSVLNNNNPEFHRISAKLPRKKATLLTGCYVEINLLPLQFAEYNDFIRVKSPNLPNNETLANFIQYGSVPEYIKQLQIGEKQADMFVDSILKTIVEKDISRRAGCSSLYSRHGSLCRIYLPDRREWL